MNIRSANIDWRDLQWDAGYEDWWLLFICSLNFIYNEYQICKHWQRLQTRSGCSLGWADLKNAFTLSCNRCFPPQQMRRLMMWSHWQRATTTTKRNMSSILDSTQTMKTSVSDCEVRKVYLFPATTLEHAPLEAVYIYFDTATYDEIDKDEKVTLEKRNCMSKHSADLETILRWRWKPN